ncbi:YwpF family protein [Lacicoccus qingdaonensis]|uniref:YwpF-like protein n=1 Tax=Lacicoccus qingdaonensis TaxID=576118 RepID=A0A1G9I062_9BACL|nr:YwpF family protein [Salinicoccus qingdaonensis]SDL18627.1 YwpF-like protein [Salinicoccus qingdaonensis]
MKSFKIVDIKMQHENNYIILDLLDGIIINKEADKDSWIVEVAISGDFKDILEEFVGTEVTLLIRITRTSNQPALFEGKFLEMNSINSGISLLFIGDIIQQDPNYAENLLEKLMEENYEGDALLNEFKARMDSKDDIKTSD